jgi:hypothetical protein
MKCEACTRFDYQFSRNCRWGECDCPKCQGYCACRALNLSEAVYFAALDRTGDADIADAVRDSVMGDFDDGMSDESFWSLVDETVMAHTMP